VSLPGVFRAQARACAALGSPFTARLLTLLADALRPGLPVFDRVLNWQGDPTPAGQSVPLRLAGGVHALVLSGQDPALAALYPPQPAPSDAALTKAVLAAIPKHQDTLMQWLDFAPQTNEVARSAVLLAAGHLLADRYNLPLRLLELGASAGLNLQWDRTALRIGNDRFGPDDAPLVLAPDWTGAVPIHGAMHIAQRAGVDLNPLDAADPADRLRMMSYVWPDQPNRIARMKIALDRAQAFPVRVAKADAAGWITDRLTSPVKGVTTIVYHTIAWQYFPTATKDIATAAIQRAGAAATPDAPLAWLSMETDGRADGAAVSLRLWPGDSLHDLGRADFHGRWVRWQNL